MLEARLRNRLDIFGSRDTSDNCFVTALLAARLDGVGELENVLCRIRGMLDSVREKAAAKRLVLVVPPLGEDVLSWPCGGGVGDVDFFDEGFRTNAKMSFITLDFSFRSAPGEG